MKKVAPCDINAWFTCGTINGKLPCKSCIENSPYRRNKKGQFAKKQK